MIHTTSTLVSVQNRQRRRYATGQRLLPDVEHHRNQGERCRLSILAMD